jgi:hypothetical protein
MARSYNRMSLNWNELEQIRGQRAWNLPIPPTCPYCNYILTGLPGSRCPECGADFNWKEVRRRAARTWTLTNRLKHANQDARGGIRIALIGWGAIVLAWVFHWACSTVLLLMLAAAASVIALVLSTQILNVRLVPKWAREHIGQPPPDMLLGAGAILLALSILPGVLISLWVLL